jgi:hypothetical protein
VVVNNEKGNEMIIMSKVTRFTAGDGSEHNSLEEAQVRDLTVMLSDELAEKHPTLANLTPVFVQAILAQSKRVVDVLTTRLGSIPRARSVNGGKKVRKPSKHVAAQFALPVTGGDAAGVSEPVTTSAA